MLYVLGVYMICDNYLIKLKKKNGSETLLDQKDGRDCREIATNLEWLAETEITGKNIAHILQKEKKDSNMIWLGFDSVMIHLALL